MNNTQKDRYENKLNRFIKECDKEWQKYKVEKPEYCHILGWYDSIAERVRKKLGLTEDDVQRAWSLRRHHSDRHFWHDIRFRYKGAEKQKAYDRAEKNGSRAQYSDEELEAWLKGEDDWIMDVYDEWYDPETDMSR